MLTRINGSVHAPDASNSASEDKLTIRKADIQSAYLQGKPVDRVILYRIRKGGIPEEGINEGDVIAARVPIYGTKDAGRGWWLRLNDVAKEHGFTANRILPTLFAFRNKDQQIVTNISKYQQISTNIVKFEQILTNTNK